MTFQMFLLQVVFSSQVALILIIPSNGPEMILYVSNSPISRGRCAGNSWSSVADLLTAGLQQSSFKCVFAPLVSAKNGLSTFPTKRLGFFFLFIWQQRQLWQRWQQTMHLIKILLLQGVYFLP